MTVRIGLSLATLMTFLSQAPGTDSGMEWVKMASGGGACAILAFVVYRLVAVEMPAARDSHRADVESLLSRYDKLADSIRDCPVKKN